MQRSICFGLLLTFWTIPSSSQAQPPDPTRVKKLELTVLADDSGKPIEGASVDFSYSGKNRQRETVTTSADGLAVFRYPKATEGGSLSMTARRPGHVPYYVYFDRQPFELLATAKTIRMDKGEVIGGVITGDDGKPLQGASVQIRQDATESTRTSFVFRMLDVTTGADGRWQLDAAPIPATGLRLDVNHPEYLRKYFDVQSGSDATYQLQRGWRIAGTVTGPDGNPVADAVVHVGTDHFGSSKPEAKTDDQGQYELVGLKHESTFVTVTAKRYAPQLKSIDIDDGKDGHVNFQLEPGHTMTMEVVDPSGKPIANVGVTADTWRGYRTVEWRSRTDADGRAVWPGAPSDVVMMDFYGRNYRSNRDVPLIAGDKVHRIVLHPEVVASGTAVDAVTGKPIGEMTVCFGRKRSPGDDLYWIDYRAKQGRDGKFRITHDEAAFQLFVRITADGYQPWISPPIDPDAPSKPFEAKLEPGVGPAGKVVTPGGQPAAGADVILSTEKNRFQFTSGYRASDPEQKVRTNRDGHFQLQSLTDPDVAGLVAIVHDSGYREVPLDELDSDAPIVLDRWARIEVEAWKGKSPDVGARITFDPRDVRSQPGSVFSYGIETESDDQGRAVLERVVPRKGYVSRRITQPMKSGWMSIGERGETIDVQPGETYQVKLGGSGRAMVGRIELPPNPPDSHLWRYNDAGRLETSGLDWNDPEHRSYQFLVDRDGTFRIDDVPAGIYELRIRLTAEPNASQCGGGALIGSVKLDGIHHTEDSLAANDLGQLSGTWIEFKRAGDAAPDFVARTSDGTPIQGDDFRGKLLLIDFWATWCTPCLAEMPQLAEMHEKYQADDRFAMLGVAIDKDFAHAVEMSKKRGWNWMMADGGQNFSSLFPSSFDVRAIPSKFLVGSDGTILYRGTDLQEIDQLIKTTLKKMPDRPAPDLPQSGIQSRAVEDDFQPTGRKAHVVLAFDRPYLNKHADKSMEPKAGMFLYDGDGELVRHIESVAPSGWLKHPDRIAIDRKRGRVYVADPTRGLVAVNRDGSYAFETPLDRVQAVAVDEKTGDVWCVCSGYLNSGWTVVLDSDGNHVRKLPEPAFSLRYSAAADAFWLIGKEARLVTRDGKTICRHAIPEDAYTLAALAVDSTGGCWALEDSHPDVGGSREATWRFTKESAEVIGDRDKIDADTNRGITRSWVEVIGDKVWVGVKENSGDKEIEPQQSVRVFSSDGKLVDQWNESWRGAGVVGDQAWILQDNGIVQRRSGKTVDREFVIDNQITRGIYQSVWIAGW